MRALVSIIAAAAFHATLGQWQSVGGGVSANPFDLTYDEASGRLYVVGMFRHTVTDSLEVNGIAYWEQGSWHPVGGGVDHPWAGGVPPIQTLLVTDTALLVAGVFLGIAGVPNTRSVAQWKNGQWQPWGQDSATTGSCAATRINTLDGHINILGACSLRDPQGDTIQSWLVWDGTQWSAGAPDQSFWPRANAAIRYQGDLYVGGNFNDPNGMNDLLRLGPNGWEPVGPGLLGDPWVNAMVEYDGLLWVCGEFAAAAGNAANGLMAWDGQQWINPFPQLVSLSSQCKDIQVIHGKLIFTTGSMQVAGLSGFRHVGVYDGQQLCVVGGPQLNIGRFTASADTLYIQTSKHLDGQAGLVVNHLASWPMSAAPDTCFQTVVVVQEARPMAPAWQLYPNPTQGLVHLAGAPAMPVHIRIADAQGRWVYEQAALHPADPLDLRHLAPGHYVLHGQAHPGATPIIIPFILQP